MRPFRSMRTLVALLVLPAPKLVLTRPSPLNAEFGLASQVVAGERKALLERRRRLHSFTSGDNAEPTHGGEAAKPRGGGRGPGRDHLLSGGEGGAEDLAAGGGGEEWAIDRPALAECLIRFSILEVASDEKPCTAGNDRNAILRVDRHRVDGEGPVFRISVQADRPSPPNSLSKTPFGK